MSDAFWGFFFGFLAAFLVAVVNGIGIYYLAKLKQLNEQIAKQTDGMLTTMTREAEEKGKMKAELLGNAAAADLAIATETDKKDASAAAAVGIIAARNENPPRLPPCP